MAGRERSESADSETTERSGLRERRHQRTAREIRDAALQLFERQGYARTTVDQIAQMADISPRTFFRYCASKEGALLLDEEGVDMQILDTIHRLRPGDDVLRALEQCVVGIMEKIEEVPAHRTRTRRMRRVVRDEPALVSASLREETTRNDRFVSALVAAGMADRLHASATVLVLSASMRLATDEWVQDDGPQSFRLVDHFHRCQTVLHAVVTKGSQPS